MLSVSLNVPFGEAEVDQKDLMCGLIEAHTKVIRFYISVDKMSVVDVLDAADHLVDQH